MLHFPGCEGRDYCPFEVFQKLAVVQIPSNWRGECALAHPVAPISDTTRFFCWEPPNQETDIVVSLEYIIIIININIVAAVHNNSLTFFFVLKINVPIINKLTNEKLEFEWNVNYAENWDLSDQVWSFCLCSKHKAQKTLNLACWAMIKFLDPHFHYWDLVPERNGGAHNAAHLGSLVLTCLLLTLSH